ncbi:MAG: T9SS type A sorting domain-containing protein, partial [Bacteroidia bacterium]|nr:T9SS type A sorting domain-containing protein [Bacteroidia bacterium]
GHTGSIIYTSNMAYLPDHDLCVVAMTNDGRAAADLSFVINITEQMICLYLETVVSTDEQADTDNQLKIYPNPATVELNLDFENPVSDLTVKVYNQLGQKVAYYSAKQKENYVRLNTVDWANGSYIIHITTKEKQIIRKVIKQ